MIRWLVYGVFVLSSVLNFLDRQVLAALAPEIMREFSLNKGQYGDLISVFSIVYAASAPLLGWFIDRVGLTRGSSMLVALWSMAGMATGLVQGFAGLLAARAFLGFAEAGSISGSNKANALYLEPRERSLGAGINQFGLTLGAVLAPLAGQWMSSHFGWRSAFFLTGATGFLWIPLWLWISRRAPAHAPPDGQSLRAAQVIRDARFWLLLAANIAIMSIYSLWVNWTTVFLVAQHGLTQSDANQRLAWLPQVCGTLGGLCGGWLALRWSGAGIVASRLRASLVGSILVLVTALIPFAPTPGLATAGICLSFFAVLIISVNVYSLPLDFFGPGPAAFAAAGLTCSYGILQTVFSSTAGRVADLFGFTPVLLAVAPLPLIGWLLLWLSAKR
jgi:ACS family hexuronate transporter-like MFS transporter